MSDDLTRLEDDLRRALREDAASIRPHDRLDAILREAHEPYLLGLDGRVEGARTPSIRIWLSAVAAAAAVVAALTVGTLLSDRQGPTTPQTTSEIPTSGPTGFPTSTPTPTVSGTGSPTATATATATSTTTATPTATVAVPVYYLGHEVDATGAAVLVREFMPVQAQGATVERRLVLALDSLLGAKDSPYTPGWDPVAETHDVAVTSSGIALRVSSDQARGRPTHEAVAALVLTAQAVVGRGDLPVTIELSYPATSGKAEPLGTFRRSDVADVALASIWVDEPSRGQTFAAGRAVKVKGIASVFEAALSWRLTRGGSEVASGHTMTGEAAPARAAYTIDLGTLQAGDYVVTVQALSAKDGSLAAARSVAFTVG